jgi:hypothetical protein
MENLRRGAHTARKICVLPIDSSQDMQEVCAGVGDSGAGSPRAARPPAASNPTPVEAPNEWPGLPGGCGLCRFLRCRFLHPFSVGSGLTVGDTSSTGRHASPHDRPREPAHLPPSSRSRGSPHGVVSGEACPRPSSATAADPDWLPGAMGPERRPEACCASGNIELPPQLASGRLGHLGGGLGDHIEARSERLVRRRARPVSSGWR